MALNINNTGRLTLIWLLAGLWLSLWVSAPVEAFSDQNRRSALEAPPAQTGAKATLQDLLGAVSGDRLTTWMQAISRFSRCLTDPGHAEAGRYIQDELKTLGFNPLVQPFPVSLARGLPTYNIAARLPGSNPRRAHLLVGHWDSSPVRQFPPACNNLAPGANDNGTGSAALLEIARLLGGGRAAFQDDILLVWLDAEEFGYLGSQHLVQNWNSDHRLNPAGLPLGAVINLDMIGFSGPKGRSEVWAVTEGAESLALAHEAKSLATAYLPEVKFGIYTIGEKFPAARDPNRNSDQRSFWDAGQGAAIFLTEDVEGQAGFDPRWHTQGDKLHENDRLRLNPVQMADATRVALLTASVQAGIGPGRFFPDLRPAFEQNWSRADRPVKLAAEGGPAAGRGWLWGPQPVEVRLEPYAESPDGLRPVAYFDKARMELNGPSAGVTNGLLVMEMTTGQLQLGDNRFRYVGPSHVQVAGDTNAEGRNPAAPTYASFKRLVEGPPAPDRSGLKITATLSKNGEVGQNPALAGLAANRYYVRETGYNIAGVFWDYFGASGRTYNPERDEYGDGRVFDWLSAVGLPVSEAYWVRTEVEGTARDVLVQLFQRRVLTYTPSNPAGWQVEMGNAGRHYLAWRY